MALSQYGGENTEKYSGKKSDESLKQYGGEGTEVGKKGNSNIGFGDDYCGPGRYVKIEGK
jgi:hypothetical protein